MNLEKTRSITFKYGFKKLVRNQDLYKSKNKIKMNLKKK